MDTDNTDNTSEGAGLPRPLGYWLRTVDHLITREFDAAFEKEGVTRRDWMLLNVISGDVDIPALRERLARRGKKLRGLESRGWVQEQGDGTWALTDEGLVAKERIGGLAGGIRTRVAGAVSPEDYATTMASLEAIALELGWNEDLDVRGGRGRGHGRGRRGHGFGHGFGPRHGFNHRHGHPHARGFDHAHGSDPRCAGRA